VQIGVSVPKKLLYNKIKNTAIFDIFLIKINNECYNHLQKHGPFNKSLETLLKDQNKFINMNWYTLYALDISIPVKLDCS